LCNRSLGRDQKTTKLRKIGGTGFEAAGDSSTLQKDG
jgi:hypothetical protein